MFLSEDVPAMHVKMINVKDKASSDELENVHARKNHHIITLYYRDGCPPCDKMKPEWKRACEMFKKKYKCKDKGASERTVIASVDNTGINYLNNVFHEIQGTPTMLYISDGTVKEYDGNSRQAEDFLKWFEQSLKSEIVPVINKKMRRQSNSIRGGCWTMTTNKQKSKRSRRSKNGGGRTRKVRRHRHRTYSKR